MVRVLDCQPSGRGRVQMPPGQKFLSRFLVHLCLAPGELAYNVYTDRTLSLGRWDGEGKGLETHPHLPRLRKWSRWHLLIPIGMSQINLKKSTIVVLFAFTSAYFQALVKTFSSLLYLWSNSGAAVCGSPVLFRGFDGTFQRPAAVCLHQLARNNSLNSFWIHVL